MRVLILSDIHANLEALTAALEDASRAGFDDVVCLGDIVGYGASPAGVIDQIVALAPRLIVRGNHDKACAGLDPATDFSPLARRAMAWTRRQLSPEALRTLAALPRGPLAFDADTALCHGAPFDEDFYVLDTMDARRVLMDPPARLCLHGHTHVQTVFHTDDGVVVDETPAGRAKHVVVLNRHEHWLVNAGSVGQPRDGDPRAGYAILDTAAETVELYRVVYDVPRAQQRIRAAGLPAALATRLASGK